MIMPVLAQQEVGFKYHEGFISNEGQWDAKARFQTSYNGTNVYFLKDGLSFGVTQIDETFDANEMNLTESSKTLVYSLTFDNANPNSEIQTVNSKPSVYNYSYWIKSRKSC